MKLTLESEQIIKLVEIILKRKAISIRIWLNLDTLYLLGKIIIKQKR